jgi:hypothetical protein
MCIISKLKMLFLGISEREGSSFFVLVFVSLKTAFKSMSPGRGSTIVCRGEWS